MKWFLVQTEMNTNWYLTMVQENIRVLAEKGSSLNSAHKKCKKNVDTILFRLVFMF